MTSLNSHFPGRRRGAVLAMVLIFSTVVITVVGMLIQTIARHHRNSRSDHQRLQTFWLAESAAQRAVARLQATPDYMGETWRVNAGDSKREQIAVATILVEPVVDRADQRRVTINCAFPDGSNRRSQITRRFQVKLNSNEDSS